jgi:hypothetical protein
LQRAGDGILPSRTLVLLPEENAAGVTEKFIAAECRNQHAKGVRSPEFTLARYDALASINVIIPRVVTL